MWGNKFDVPTFRVGLADIEKFIDRLQEALPEGWKRVSETEPDFRERDPNPTFLFAKDGTTHSRKPHVTISRTAPDEWQASDVTFLQGNRFSREERDALLTEFENALVTAASNGGVRVEFLSECPRSGRELRSAAAATRWRRFLSGVDANRVTQKDLRRWDEFAVQAYLDETALDEGALDEWLQAAGFPDTVRQQLVAEYQKAGSVLSAYDEIKEGV